MWGNLFTCTTVEHKLTTTTLGPKTQRKVVSYLFNQNLLWSVITFFKLNISSFSKHWKITVPVAKFIVAIFFDIYFGIARKHNSIDILLLTIKSAIYVRTVRMSNWIRFMAYFPRIHGFQELSSHDMGKSICKIKNFWLQVPDRQVLWFTFTFYVLRVQKKLNPKKTAMKVHVGRKTIFHQFKIFAVIAECKSTYNVL